MNFDFNFNNIVSLDNSRELKQNNYIMLEPRLQEYLNKKKFYKENNIVPTIMPEKEFCITNMDKRIIKSFLNGNKNIYDNKNYEKFYKSKEIKKTYFPSTLFEDDPRVLDIEKPSLRKNIKDNGIVNRGMFVPDRNNITGYYEDASNIDSKKPLLLDARDFPEPKVKMNYKRGSNNYHESFVTSNNNMEAENVLDQLLYDAQERKNEYKNNNISMSTLNYRLQNYNKLPNNSSINENILIDSELLRGKQIYSRNKSSIGYKNPEEHYYGYIERQNPIMNHVEPWDNRMGASTRLDNQKIQKDYKREVL